MMNENHDFRSYLEGLIHDIPSEIYVGAAIILCLGLLFLIKWKGIKQGLRFAAFLALIEYVVLIYCSTVLFRATRNVHKYDFHPFWSYRAIEEGRLELLPENIMNVIVFIPVGMILGSLLKVKGSWLIALLIGCSISVTIESLQFFFMRGFSEVDDVMHNTVGCLLGWFMVKGLRFMVNS